MKVCIQAPQRLIVDALFALVEALGFEPVLPDDPGIDVGLSWLFEQAPPFPVAPPRPTLAIIGRDESAGLHAIRQRYRGIVHPDETGDVLRRAFPAIRRGEIWVERALLFHLADTPEDEHLTGREQQILERILRGAPNRQIAEELGIAEGTVKMHVTHIFAKRRVSSRAELLARALASRSGSA